MKALPIDFFSAKVWAVPNHLDASDFVNMDSEIVAESFP
jgi:hypothetical protein